MLKGLGNWRDCFSEAECLLLTAQLPSYPSSSSTSKQEPALIFCESPYWHHTANKSPSPPPNPQQPLFCSALFSSSWLSPFSAKSQIGGWGAFCGPNKRAKVVRTPLCEGGGGGAVTQTASLSGLGLYGPTGLGCSLATVTHGEWERARERGEGGAGRQGSMRTVGTLQRTDPLHMQVALGTVWD